MDRIKGIFSNRRRIAISFRCGNVYTLTFCGHEDLNLWIPFGCLLQWCGSWKEFYWKVSVEDESWMTVVGVVRFLVFKHSRAFRVGVPKRDSTVK